MANVNEPLNRNRIKEVRLIEDKTQADLARLVGVTDRTIANWEKAKSEPNLKTWAKLARYLHASVYRLQGMDRL